MPDIEAEMKVFIIIFEDPFALTVYIERVFPPLKNSQPTNVMKVPNVIKIGLCPVYSK